MNKASSVSKGGLFTALSVIFIYLSTIISTNRLFFLGSASLIIPICIIMIDIKSCLLVYISSSLISILLLGPRTTVVSYIVFFGIYGIVKLYVEKIKSLPIELIIKLIFFNISILLVYFLFKLVFAKELTFNYEKYKYLLLLALQITFLIYDYALTLFINYIERRFVRKFK